MRRVCCAVVLCCLASTVMAADEPDKSGDHKVNWGIKAGFSSSLLLLSDLSYQGHHVSKEQVRNDYRIGYFGTLFARFNMKRHFIQPEAAYVLNHGKVELTVPVELPPQEGVDAVTQVPFSVSQELHGIDAGLLYGYSLIKEHPYGLSLFAGPKLQFMLTGLCDTRLVFNHNERVEESLHFVNASLTLGMAVTIAPLFFDFRYDVGLTNLSKRLYMDGAFFKRRQNVLSFSLGVIF